MGDPVIITPTELPQPHALMRSDELLWIFEQATAAGDKKLRDAAAAILRDAWATPPELFTELHAQYGFTVDTAAEKANAKLPRWFGPDGEQPDGLAVSWVGECWFGNWPFSQLDKWLAHAWAQYRQGMPRASIGVALMPATRTEQSKAWQKYVEPYRDNIKSADRYGVYLQVKFLEGRTEYVPPAGVAASSPRFGSVLVIWHPM